MLQNSPRLSTVLPPTYALLFAGVVIAQGCQSDPSLPSGGEQLSVPGHELRLDLDADGIPDFLFSYQGTQKADIPPSAVSWILNVDGFDDHQVQYNNAIGTIPMLDGATISDASGWSVFDTPLATRAWERGIGWSRAWVGVWIGVGPRSLGLRLKKSDGWHYGWVKLAVDARTGNLSILDSAWQRQPDRPIRAGLHG